MSDREDSEPEEPDYEDFGEDEDIEADDDDESGDEPGAENEEPAASRMIGRVLILAGRGLAMLVGRNEWRVVVYGKRSRKWEQTLSLLYEDAYAGPQDGAYGIKILQDLADMNGVEPDIPERPEGRPDPLVVY